MFRVWTDDEDNKLRELSRKLHITQIVSIWNQLANENKWCERSRYSISSRLIKLKLNCIASEDNFLPNRLAKILEINATSVRTWLSEGKLKSENYSHTKQTHENFTKEYNQIRLISKQSFKEFVITHPYELWDIGEKNLSKLIDRKLAKEVAEIADTNKQIKKVKMTIVRLSVDGYEPKVFPSINQAFLNVNSSIAAISRNLNRDTPTQKDGHFVKLDYPVYLVPLKYRDDFNQLAGKLLIRIFDDLSKIEGYRKTICIVVAVRQAVQIALMTFRREHRLLLDNKTFDDKESYSEYWIEKFYSLYNFHANARDSQKSISKIKSTLKFFVYPMFMTNYKSKADYHFDEYSINLIAKWSNTYYSRSVLPYNYKPQSRFEYGDIFTYVNGLAMATVTLPDKSQFKLAKLEAFAYFKKHPNETELNNEWLAHNETHPEPDTNLEYSEQLDEIISNLNSLDISDDLLQDTIKFVETFMTTNDFGATRNKLNISYGRQQEILETLKKSSLPF